MLICMAHRHTAEVLTCRFNIDGSHVASGCSEGVITIRATSGECNVVQVLKSADTHRDAVTCIRYRPKSGKDAAQNMLLASCG